ncbi:hypothetical protein Poli38472_010990 [Pythium oligandrum]|uniref:Uncharacterized protein n=1 Tax=Pythium oligandrum TaxID=41045 RepID=A0A8K1CEN8_PYTOL|nr:hypothetical protein Poli38472_010990 [Pythium oligandrum]|eukprot:TMW61927.1 hypothetical protein Poli38472_010990 [Pythium oligandrum]
MDAVVVSSSVAPPLAAEDVTVFKLVSLVSIWVVGLAGGLLPSLVASRQQHSPLVKHVLSVLNAFSGGVFLAGGFFHLLHSAIENPALQRWSTMDDGRYEFPYAEMFCTIGFLGLLLLEQAAHARMDDHERRSDEELEHDRDIHDSDATASDDYMESFDDEDDDPEAQTLKSFTRKKTKKHSHAHSHGSGHSHMVMSGNGGNSPAVALVLFLALSFHSVLEGLGIGAQQTSAWGVFLAIVLHKGLAAFALGSGMVQSSLSRAHVIAYMVLFSFMSIIGIIVGWIIAADSSEDSAAAGICVALASGTFIYVAVMEVIPQEFPRHAPSSPYVRRILVHKTSALCLGYAIFGLLAKWS